MYSFDKVSDKWAELSDTYASYLDELENAKAVWRKKFSMSPNSREEWAKQARFLQSRGFGFEIIRKVINEQEDH